MSAMFFCMYILFILHICILRYIHVTALYYILACFQKINVNVNVNIHLQAPAGQLSFFTKTLLFFFSFFLSYSQKIVLQDKESSLETKHRTEQNTGTNVMSFSYTFCCFLFFHQTQRAVRYYYLSYYVMTPGSFIWFELEKENNQRKNAMCVKLNLYFFYKHIVYQYLFAYIDIA